MPEVVAEIQQALLVRLVVAEVTGVALAEMFGPDRGCARAAFARQMAMYMCRLVFAMSFGDIAVAFARDRSTAAYAVRRIEEAREHPVIDRQLAFVEAALRQGGGPHG
jgi:chromosomal replication initiation ATPase DnaA